MNIILANLLTGGLTSGGQAKGKAGEAALAGLLGVAQGEADAQGLLGEVEAAGETRGFNEELLLSLLSLYKGTSEKGEQQAEAAEEPGEALLPVVRDAAQEADSPEPEAKEKEGETGRHAEAGVVYLAAAAVQQPSEPEAEGRGEEPKPGAVEVAPENKAAPAKTEAPELSPKQAGGEEVAEGSSKPLPGMEAKGAAPHGNKQAGGETSGPLPPEGETPAAEAARGLAQKPGEVTEKGMKDAGDIRFSSKDRPSAAPEKPPELRLHDHASPEKPAPAARADGGPEPPAPGKEAELTPGREGQHRFGPVTEAEVEPDVRAAPFGDELGNVSQGSESQSPAAPAPAPGEPARSQSILGKIERLETIPREQVTAHAPKGSEGASRAKSLTMKIYPPNLEPLSMKVEVRGEEVRAHFVVHTSDAKQVMEAGFFSLREGLSNQGFEVRHLGVQVGGQSGQNPQQGMTDQKFSPNADQHHPDTGHAQGDQAKDARPAWHREEGRMVEMVI